MNFSKCIPNGPSIVASASLFYTPPPPKKRRKTIKTFDPLKNPSELQDEETSAQFVFLVKVFVLQMNFRLICTVSNFFGGGGRGWC